MLTSAGGGDGKSTVTLGLAYATSELGLTTVVVEADLRRPAFARYPGLPSSAGSWDGAGSSGRRESNSPASTGGRIAASRDARGGSGVSRCGRGPASLWPAPGQAQARSTPTRAGQRGNGRRD
jgi:hypothetical protein